MLNGLKRISLSLHRHAFSFLRDVSIFAVRHDGVGREELLNAMLEGLHVARDSKALVVARDGIIIQMNALACQLCGLTLQELHGKPVSPALFEEPRTVRQSAAIERWETGLKAATGELIPVEVVRHPVGNRFQDVVVYAVRDLRERREAIEERNRQIKRLQQQDHELRAQNLRFDTAINNMPVGLAMFDAEKRLVVCNRLYAELYGLSPEQVKPGTTIRELLEYRHAKGVFGNIDDFDTFVRDWLAEFSAASTRHHLDCAPADAGRRCSEHDRRHH
jgi:PAS domain S-box-containing protein